MFWGDPGKMRVSLDSQTGNEGQRHEMDILFLPRGLSVFYVTSCVSEHPTYLRTFLYSPLRKS